MKRITWLILILVIVSVMLIVVNTGITTSYFVDDEPSTDDALGIKWGLITLDDGFENTPWDDKWNENGTTTWFQDSSAPHQDLYNAKSDNKNKGYLTSDEIDASAADNISVSFWFNLKSLEAGDCLVQLYNGTSYNTWHDLSAYSTYVDSTWCLFNEVITNPQYFLAGFRLMFDTSAMGGGEEANIDDVYITTDSIPPAVPMGLVATEGDMEVSLNWADNTEGDLAGYDVYRSETMGGPYSQINGSLVTDSEYTDNTVTNDVTYYYVVTAVDYGNNESGYSNEDSATPTDLPPAAPTGLVATEGDEEVTLEWNDNSESDLDGYNVYRSETMGGSYTKINASLLATSDYTDSEVSELVTYYYVVKAVDWADPVAHESDYSNEDSATPDWAPAAPTGLVATEGDEEVTLNWNDNSESDIAGYDVYRSETMGGPYTKINASLVATSDYTDNTVTELVTYYYVVKAIDSASNESGYSNEDSVTPDWAPVAPTGLVATEGDEEVTLNWNDNSEGDLAGYNVYRSTTIGGPYTKINGSLVVPSDYTDNTVTELVTYYYVVKAIDSESNESDYSNEDSATPDWAPAAPTGLVATEGDEEVTLNWNDNSESDIAGYDVYRSTTIGGPYTKINGSLVVPSDYTDNTVTELVTYYYVVKAIDSGSNESDYSNEDSATTDWAPAAPTGLVATEGDMEVSLNWADNTEGDLAGYDVYRSTIMGGPYSQINGSLVVPSDYIDTTVSNGVTYYYVVKAVDSGSNESDYSNEDSATPFDVAPAAPTGLVATEGVAEVTLDWNDNSESDLAGYDVYRSEAIGGPYSQMNGSLVLTSDYTDSTVTELVTYYYVVKAVDSGSNESAYSNEDSATPDWAPAAPTGLVATEGDEEVSLNWADNSESDLAGYDVYRSETMGGPYSQINASLVLTSDYTDSGVTELVTYYYVVKAVDSGSNESGYSNEDSATPDWAPAAPTGLMATDGDEEITLDWNDNSESDLAGYNVYRSEAMGGPYSKINTSLVVPSGYTDIELYGGGTYYYVVTAVDSESNKSGYSNEDSAIATDVAPAAPTGLVAAKGIGQVTLDWNDNSEGDLAGYDVYRSETMGGPYSKINSTLVASSDYIDTGVINGVTYYYVVKAVDSGSNESSYSNEDSARPVGPPQTLLDDGFELTPWDQNWDGNGTTTWFQDSTAPHQGSFNAKSDNKNKGLLTSDDLDTFAAENITVTFWFKLSGLDAGDIVVQIYNGSTYNTWYDLTAYSTYIDQTWCQFSEVITDSQYFITNFRIRFVTASVTGQEEANIDDVLIAINQ